MCDTIFALGQRGGYHFETTSKWQFGLLPSELRNLFNSTDQATSISTCYHLSLGANESFFVSYKSKANSSCLHSVDIPEQLKGFLYEKDSSGSYARQFTDLRIALGPRNKSWWATDGKTSKWMNLPPGLNDAFKELRSDNGTGPFTDAPTFVTFGCDGNYFMLTEQGSKYWDLGSYRELNQLINECKDSEAGLRNIKSLVLHPYRLDCWILQTKAGAVFAKNLPPHMDEDFSSIQASIKDDTVKALEVQALQERVAQVKALETRLAQQRLLNQTVSMMASLAMMNTSFLASRGS